MKITLKHIWPLLTNLPQYQALPGHRSSQQALCGWGTHFSLLLLGAQVSVS